MRSKHQLVMRPLQLIRLCLPKDKIDSAVLLPHDTNLDTAITLLGHNIKDIYNHHISVVLCMLL